MNAGTTSLVFFGTPEFAVPSLRALAADSRFAVQAVVTQPDKPAGRGERLTPPPIKDAALALGLPVLQPPSLKSLELYEEGQRPRLRAGKAAEHLASFLNELPAIDLFVCVAYGKLIPGSLLRFPPRGMVNIHPSLLPRWRGAAPIQRALFAGDARTGVALMDADEGLDSGPVYAVRELPILESDCFGTLHDKLAAIGAEMLIEHLPDIAAWRLRARPQEEREDLVYAEKWEKADCRIRWSEPAAVTLRRIRTCAPAPGAFTLKGDVQIKVYAAESAPDRAYRQSPPGTIVDAAGRLVVSAGDSEYISLKELQLPGKKRLPAAELLRGRAFAQGDHFE